MSNYSPSTGGDIVSPEMRVSLFLNLLMALTGFSTSQNALDVKRGVVSKNAPSANVLTIGKLTNVLSVQIRKPVTSIMLLCKAILVVGFTYIVTRSEWGQR